MPLIRVADLVDKYAPDALRVLHGTLLCLQAKERIVYWDVRQVEKEKSTLDMSILRLRVRQVLNVSEQGCESIAGLNRVKRSVIVDGIDIYHRQVARLALTIGEAVYPLNFIKNGRPISDR